MSNLNCLNANKTDHEGLSDNDDVLTKLTMYQLNRDKNTFIETSSDFSLSTMIPIQMRMCLICIVTIEVKSTY